MSTPFGGRILPWRNPLQYPSRGLRSENLAFPSPRAYTIGSGNTTDTVNYTLVTSAINANAPLITSRRSFMLLTVILHVRSSVTNNNFDMAVSIYDDAPGTTALGTNFILDRPTPDLSGQSTIVETPLWFDLDFVGANPGRHALAAFVRPGFASTLTWADNGGGDHWGWLIVGGLP